MRGGRKSRRNALADLLFLTGEAWGVGAFLLKAGATTPALAFASEASDADDDDDDVSLAGYVMMPGVEDGISRRQCMTNLMIGGLGLAAARLVLTSDDEVAPTETAPSASPAPTVSPTPDQAPADSKP
jgi:hypothetical protein